MLTPRLRETLVTLMVETRGWNPTACREALQALADKAPDLSPHSFARMVGVYVAHENEQGGPYFTTPALLPEPGRHWDKTEYATRKVHPKCPEHNASYPCEACESKQVIRDRVRIREIRRAAWQETEAERQARRLALHGRSAA